MQWQHLDWYYTEATNELFTGGPVNNCDFLLLDLLAVWSLSIGLEAKSMTRKRMVKSPTRTTLHHKHHYN